MNLLMEKLQRGLSSHQSGDLEAAESSYRQVLRIDGAHPDALHLLGVVHMQTGKHTQAVELIGQAIQHCPKNHIYYSNLGASYRGLGQFDQAIAAYSEALRLKPDYPQAWYNLGCSFEALKKWGEAEEAYKQTLRLLPDFAPALNNLGNVLLKLENLNDAEQVFGELTRLQPGSAEAFYNLGNTQFANAKYEESLKSLKSAEQLNPHLAGLNFSFGQLAHYQGDLENAVIHYERELKDSPQNPRLLINLGSALSEQGDFDQAMNRFQESAVGMANSSLALAQSLMKQNRHEEATRHFDHAIELIPENVDAYLGGLYVHLLSGNQARAIEIGTLAVERFPDNPKVHHHFGVMMHQLGRKQEALQPLQRSLELQPESGEAEYQLGTILMELGRSEEAFEHYQKTLRLAPQQFGAWNNLGNIHCQNKEWDKAHECFLKAVDANANSPEVWNNLGNSFQRKNELDQAISSYQRALELRPEYADAFRNIAQAFYTQGKIDEAQAAYQEAIRIRPDYFEAWNNLGIVYQAKRDAREAEHCYREALKINPTYADARGNLAFLVHMRGDYDTAIVDLKKMLSEKEDSITWNNLGIAYAHKDRFEEALAAYGKSADQDLSYADPHNNMGILHANVGRMTEALKCYERALKLRPEFPEAYNNKGTAYQVQGSIDESIAAYRESLRIRPDYAEARSNLLFTLNYDVKISPEDLMLEYKAWDRLCGRNEIPYAPHTNTPDRDRRLRVGYVSPDFRVHSVAYYIEPIIANHFSEQFEVFCYAQVLNPDAMTARIRSHAHQWRNTCGMNDEQLAELVRQDQIDILVDLTGHTGRNRLPTFARKPAPVQITYLGYPNTTGLSRMDYRISDDLADPIDATAWHSEEVLRLPHGFLCYKPSDAAPAMSLPPSTTKGYITFGSFNSQSKVHEDVVRLWADVMKAVPRSRFLLKNRPLADSGICERVWREFETHGVSRDRIDLMGQIGPTDQHLDAYRRIDIALDTFPYTGTTTTCEALWMGVPVITLKGKTHASRVGVSLLSRIGLQNLIAESPTDYVRIAQEWSSDKQRLLSTRWALRSLMQSSDLCNQKLITADIETVYRQVWHRWCDQQTGSHPSE